MAYNAISLEPHSDPHAPITDSALFAEYYVNEAEAGDSRVHVLSGNNKRRDRAA